MATVKCPICRANNVIKNVDDLKITGLSEECKVCMTNEITIRLPCTHACLCRECYDKLSDEEKEDDSFEQAAIRRVQHLLHGKPESYIMVYAGQGCQVYVRNRDETMEAFFMHGDAWGQYGVDDRPQLEAFINGYTQIVEDDGENI